MRQSNKSAIVFKIALIVGGALCVVPFFGSVQAQTSQSQSSTFLEIQELRSEVAQLRDMIERQQYELRKMQRAIKQIAPQQTAVQQPLVEPAPVLSGLDEQTELSSRQLPVTDPALANTVVETSNVPESVINNESLVDVSSATGRQYPPVVEIAIGRNSVVDERILNVPENSVPDVADIALQGTENTVQAQRSLVEESALNVVETAKTAADDAIAPAQGFSLSNIKPIETISPKQVISVPASVAQVAEVPLTLDPSSVVDVISENDYYKQGFNLLKESKHAAAVTVFKKQINSYPKGERADDAYYWIAESMYVNRKLDAAKENFKAIIQGYPKSERQPDAMLKLAYIEQEQGNMIEARILLQEILQFHPKSDAALSAKNRLADIK